MTASGSVPANFVPLVDKSNMLHHVMPFVAGSYGAAVLILGSLALASLLRYRGARRRLAAIEPRLRRRAIS
ncbi:heme exporter protein CcmD [Acidiphilium sp.]|uniref:heme exporter protein CcmD n=1 Tax=Acidiphilium sp. TaxID=527 RepID=UPI003D0653A1